MEDDDIVDMYDTSSIEHQPVPTSNTKVQKSGVLLEVEINGSKFYTIDPVEFTRLQNLIQNLKNRQIINEQMIRQLQSSIKQRDQHIIRIKQDLDTKVSHER